MGIYINPDNGSKEDWLAAHGTPVPTPPESFKAVRGYGNLPVCLVDNHIFTAAAICFNQAELDVFAERDGRRKHWFLVPLTSLREGSGLTEREIEALERVSA